MNLAEVTTTLDALANGLDPATGARIPIETFQSPAVVRALATAASLLRTKRAAGVRWTEEEEARVARAFDEGMSIGDIARAHGRTKGAITIRLVKLERLDPAAVTVRERGARVAS